MLESKSAGSVSPNISFNLENGSTLAFNFQPDGRVMVIGRQNENVVAAPLTPEQVTELKNIFTAYLEKRGA